MSSLTLENGNLVLRCRYDPALVSTIKSLHNPDRKYDPANKTWIIHPKHAKMVALWVKTYLGEDISVPQATIADSKPVTQIFEVRYIGTTKTREDGSSSAYGLVGNDWKLIFPEQVLRSWFDAGQAVPGTKESLYFRFRYTATGNGRRNQSRIPAHGQTVAPGYLPRGQRTRNVYPYPIGV